MEPDLSSRAMIYFRELTALCLALALASFSAGCSFSYSSDSSSDSSNSSSDSSNNSSESSSGSSFDDKEDDKDDDGGDTAPADTSYRDDVSDYMAAAYVAGLQGSESSSAAAAGVAAAGATVDAADAPGIDVSAFRKGLSGIAAKHGIVGWESDEVTYTGIGRGLAKAGLPQQELAAYSQTLTDQDVAKAAAIERGYGQQS